MSEFKDIKDLGIFFTIDGKGHSFVGIRPNKDGFSDDFLTSDGTILENHVLLPTDDEYFRLFINTFLEWTQSKKCELYNLY